MPGKYYVKETKTLEGYQIYDKLIEIELDFNESTKVIVNNSEKEEVKIEEEKIETELEVENKESEKEVIEKEEPKVEEVEVETPPKKEEIPVEEPVKQELQPAHSGGFASYYFLAILALAIGVIVMLIAF